MNSSVLAPLLLALLALAAGARPAGPQQSDSAKQPPSAEAVADGRAPAGWKRYRFGAPALFTVLLPRPPALLPGQPPEGDGKLWSWGYYSSSDTAAYVLNYWLDAAEGAARKSEREKRTTYNNFAAGFANGLLRGGRFGPAARSVVLGERRVRIGGAEAFERDFAVGEHHFGRLRTVFAGEHMLTVSAVWLKDGPAAERAVFFDSLTLEMARGEVTGTDPLAGWKRYEPGDRAFSIVLPAEPSIEVKPAAANSPAGTYYRVVGEDDFYIVAHVPRAPVEVGRLTPAQSEFFYEQVFKAVVEKLKQDLKREGVAAELVPQSRRAATVGGLPGREQTFTLGGGAVEVRLQAAFAGEEFFSVLVSWPLEVPLGTRDAFLKSFKINLPPPPATRR